jgi:transcriptional regulator with XRE-family HTH domain
MLTFDIKKLERARVIKGWTKSRIARVVGVTPAAITYVFNGRSKNARTLRNVAEALGLTVEEILIEEPDKEPAA